VRRIAMAAARAQARARRKSPATSASSIAPTVHRRPYCAANPARQPQMKPPTGTVNPSTEHFLSQGPVMLAASPAPRSGESSLAGFSSRAEHLVDHLHELERVGIGQAVVDGLAVAARRHESVPAQPRKLLRHCRLPQGQKLLELRDRPLALGEKAQKQQPALMRQGLEEVTGPACVL